MTSLLWLCLGIAGLLLVNRPYARAEDSVPDHCQNYTVLNDSWRNLNTYDQSSSPCDAQVLSGGVWYRMMPPAGDVLPVTLPNDTACGGHYPMWISGAPPTSESDGPVELKLCANFYAIDCYWFTKIEVAFCSGGYYVYMAPIVASPLCEYAWCAVYLPKSNSSSNSSLIQGSTSATTESLPNSDSGSNDSLRQASASTVNYVSRSNSSLLQSTASVTTMSTVLIASTGPAFNSSSGTTIDMETESAATLTGNQTTFNALGSTANPTVTTTTTKTSTTTMTSLKPTSNAVKTTPKMITTRRTTRRPTTKSIRTTKRLTTKPMKTTPKPTTKPMKTTPKNRG